MKVSKFRHRLLMLYSGAVRLLTALALDEVPGFRRLRGFLYGRAMRSCGANFQVCSSCTLWGLEHMEVGKNVYLGPGVTIIALDTVKIGDGVLFGPYAVVSNADHVFRDGAYQHAENLAHPVSIGRGSWIGANSTVVGSSESIGQGVLVAANAVVTRPVEDYCIVGGVPARPIGEKQRCQPTQ